MSNINKYLKLNPLEIKGLLESHNLFDIDKGKESVGIIKNNNTDTYEFHYRFNNKKENIKNIFEWINKKWIDKYSKENE